MKARLHAGPAAGAHAAAARHCDSAYYQHLHEASPRYRQLNWLLDELPLLRAAGGRSLIEIGCGNGLLLAQAARHWPQVTGVDWARSPTLDAVLRACPQLRFVQQDLCHFAPGEHHDLLVSADVLEHLPPAQLPGTLRRLHAAATWGFHKIACYDDGHSHLSVLPPQAWLALFEDAAPGAGYRLLRQQDRARRGSARRKPVVTLSNLPAAT